MPILRAGPMLRPHSDAPSTCAWGAVRMDDCTRVNHQREFLDCNSAAGAIDGHARDAGDPGWQMTFRLQLLDRAGRNAGSAPYAVGGAWRQAAVLARAAQKAAWGAALPNDTGTLRRLVAQRSQVIQQMTRAQTRIHFVGEAW
jgi:hypothetical protein